MAARDAGSQPLAFGGSSVPSGHLGAGARLVDEDQPCRIEIELALEPSLPALQDVGAVLERD